jgi:divalent metal cation (Fe/Co/Zn/Cd) transporter
MASVLQTASPDAIRRIQRVQTVTIAWMSVEAVVSLLAAWRARSPALLAFGGDTAIELFSAVVVLWRFRASDAHKDAERLAARVAGALLFLLAAFVAITSVASLLGYGEPKPTFLGIAILVAAAVVMPWLAREKGRLSEATSSAALRADAAQSALCAYLSLIALAGLAINAIWRVKSADPISALAVLPLIVWEGSGSHAREDLRLLLVPPSVLTATPNAASSAVHDRMRVILEPDSYDLWLDPWMKDAGAASELLKPCDARQVLPDQHSDQLRGK